MFLHYSNYINIRMISLYVFFFCFSVLKQLHYTYYKSTRFYSILAFVTKCPTVSQPTCLNAQMINKNSIEPQSLQPSTNPLTPFTSTTTQTFGIIILYYIKCTAYVIIPSHHSTQHTPCRPQAPVPLTSTTNSTATPLNVPSYQ